MGRRPKYPTPEEAKENYIKGVEVSRDIWVEKCRQGADDFYDWFIEFSNAVYPVVATLPSPVGKTIDQKIDERVKPVAKAISKIAEAYRKEKVRKVRERLVRVERVANLV
ncbi:MAG: hypothetical protein ACXQTI_08790 [Candidatus Nezhaarchaeales archaeon]